MQLPAKLSENTALPFCIALSQEAQTAVQIDLDISTTQWVFPFGALVIASQIRRLWKFHKKTFVLKGFDISNPSHTYLSHIGFFQLCGFGIGNKPGQASGSDSYLPITILSYSDLQVNEMLFDEPVQKAIQRKADELAFLLTQSHNLTVTRPVSYCFRELIRNVFEHATTDECLLSGQAYRDGRVLIGVVDCGRGLRASLSEKFTVNTDGEALRLAIQPGISRVPIIADDPSPWSNSGFGLYVLSELGKKAGYFSILSGNALLAPGNQIKTAEHSGTGVHLILAKPKGTNFETLIHTIVEEGERIAHSEGRPARASKSSKST